MTKKILLIAGCSHAAGFEIYGDEDTKRNRQNSFGNLLAKKLDLKPVNIAMGGSSNSAIARSILSWMNHNYTSESIELNVLVAWSESQRMDIPYDPPIDYSNPGADWYTYENQNFLQVNMGLKEEHLNAEKEKRLVKEAQYFISSNLEYNDIVTATNIIMLQNLFKSHNIKYIMCNTMPSRSSDHSLTAKIYNEFIDKTYYIDFDNHEKCFYNYYTNLGYKNELAKYWHHGEEPHNLYSEALHNFWIEKYLT